MGTTHRWRAIQKRNRNMRGQFQDNPMTSQQSGESFTLDPLLVLEGETKLIPFWEPGWNFDIPTRNLSPIFHPGPDVPGTKPDWWPVLRLHLHPPFFRVAGRCLCGEGNLALDLHALEGPLFPLLSIVDLVGPHWGPPSIRKNQRPRSGAPFCSFLLGCLT